MAQLEIYDATLKKTITIEHDPVIASDAESKAQKATDTRRDRNMLLQQTDWAMTTDSPLTDAQKTEATTYRDKLRNFPETADFLNGNFPTKPDFL